MIKKNKIISKKELIKIINKSLSKKSYNNKDYRFFELYINLYLILTKKRKLAQLFIHHKFNKPNLFIKNMINFLNKYYPFYLIDDKHKYGIRILLHSQNYDLKKLNKSFTKKFAKDLGDFYVCAGNLNEIYKKHKYLLRPVISVSYDNKYKKEIYCEIFAQMCPPQICIKNFDKFESIKNKFGKYLKKINKNIKVHFELQKSF
jgi:hypothetical protein